MKVKKYQFQIPDSKFQIPNKLLNPKNLNSKLLGVSYGGG
jgi:hypothetical protein